MNNTLEAYIIRNKEGEPLLFTIRYHEVDTIRALTHLKKQDWPELRDEGYHTLRVAITPADPMPWEATRYIENPDDPEEVIGLEPDPDWL